jgi:hypothetical protein
VNRDLTLDGRTLTLRTASGRPVVSIKLTHGAALTAAALFLAPRATAVAAVAGMLRGMNLTVDDSTPIARPEAA